MTYEELKKEKCLDIYVEWAETNMTSNFCMAEQYDEDGNLLNEASFDEEGYMQMVSDACARVYEYIKMTDEEFEIDFLEFRQNWGSIQNQTAGDEQACMLACLYCLSYKDVNFFGSGITAVAHRIARDKFVYAWAVENQMLTEFVKLRGMLDDYVYSELLPPELRTKKALAIWKKLQDKGFIDEKFQYAWRSKLSAGIRYMLAKEFNLRLDLKYEILQQHFGESNLRKRDPYTTLCNNINKKPDAFLVCKQALKDLEEIFDS